MATGDEIKMLIEDFSADLGQPVERFDLSLELLRQAAGERLQGHQ